MVINKEEYSIIECKTCKNAHKRYNAGKYPGSSKDIRWVDESGRQFNGKQCPQCNADRVKLNKQLKRKLKDIKIDNI